MNSRLLPSSTSQLRHQPIHTKPCIEPLEARMLLAANPAGVQQTESLFASVTFVTEQTAAEWGLQPHSGDPVERILVTAEVLGAAEEFKEVNGPNHSFGTGATIHIVAVSPGSGDVYFDIAGGTVDGEGVEFGMGPDARSATLDAVVPTFDFTTNAAVNVSVHMEWTAARVPARAAASTSRVEGQTFTSVEVIRSVLRDATASGTVTIDGYGPVNFTPGTSQSASLERSEFDTITREFDTITRQMPSITSDLFSQTPVLN